MMQPRIAAHSVNVGDLLACVGKGVVSDLIREVSQTTHVALICSDRPAVVAESTAGSSIPDKDSGFITIGVQAHFLTDWLTAYDGSVQLFPLKTALTPTQREALSNWVENARRRKVGYDFAGVMRLGIERLRLNNFKWLDQADAGSVFCSEMAAEAYQNVGLLPTSLDPTMQTPDDATCWPLFNAPIQLK